MVSSRTGSAKYLRNRATLIANAKREGLTKCPGYTDQQGNHHPCGATLNYDTPGLPNSAEADHILSPKFGGTDDLDNLRILCRAQNIARGDGTKVQASYSDAEDFPLSRVW